ncbi:MAG: chaperone NapD [Spirochaetota bacterium]|nr:chaperone NapD [Spirochaetota bacterium]
MNILSLLIKTVPNHLNEVINYIKATKICEIYLKDKSGRIIVTIEGNDSLEESEKIKTIQSINHVLSVDIMYFYNGNEQDELENNITREDCDVPSILQKTDNNTGDFKNK